MSKKDIGLNNKNLSIDFFYTGKFNHSTNSYCVVFNFWTDKKSNKSYHILVQNLWCNNSLQSAGVPFVPYKKIENFVKNIEFNNKYKLLELYEDEKTRLLRKREEEKKLAEEEQRIAKEEERLVNLESDISIKNQKIKDALEDLENRIESEIIALDKFIDNFDPEETYLIIFEDILSQKADFLVKWHNISKLIGELDRLIKEFPEGYDATKIKVVTYPLNLEEIGISEYIQKIETIQIKLDEQQKILEKLKKQKRTTRKGKGKRKKRNYQISKSNTFETRRFSRKIFNPRYEKLQNVLN